MSSLPNKYAAVHEEELDDSGSLDGLMTTETSTDRRSFGRHRCEVLGKYLSYGVVGCLSAILSFIVLLRFRPVGEQSLPHLSAVPDFARTTRIWQREREWDSGPAAEKLWDNLVPGKTGIILINKPEEYGLEPGLETEVRKAGKLIREALQSVMSGNQSILTENGVGEDEDRQWKGLSHAFHWVDYLGTSTGMESHISVGIKLVSIRSAGNRN
ncbi:MAG: hypothetical protein L6R40_007677 [Gallowayella cf. fulva]|nr:MAG: hypothetical protein L6R40_007677 [Xanthomendoza cf. fulva]